MAIKRCPYCRSIIDEADRYCDNCGTQLLFPEDEHIEEDIPGKRIFEVEDKLPEEDLEIIAREEEPEPAVEPYAAEDEIPLVPSKPGKETAIPDFKFPPLEGEPLGELSLDAPRKFATRDLPEMGLEMPLPPKPSITGFFETPAEKSSPSGDFEAGFPTSTEESDDIARLMSSLEKQTPPKAPSPPPLVETEDVPFSERDLPPLRFEEEKPPTSDELPPWAERVKDGVTPGFRPPSQEDMSRDPGGLSFDSGPGLDRLFRADEEGPVTEEDFRRLAEPELRPRPRPRRRRRGPLSRLKARLYDILLVTLLWVAALWASSRVLSVPLFDIVLNSALQAGIFYLILLAGYFALFFLFLGETLGDRLSSPSA